MRVIKVLVLLALIVAPLNRAFALDSAPGPAASCVEMQAYVNSNKEKLRTYEQITNSQLPVSGQKFAFSILPPADKVLFLQSFITALLGTQAALTDQQRTFLLDAKASLDEDVVANPRGVRATTLESRAKGVFPSTSLALLEPIANRRDSSKQHAPPQGPAVTETLGCDCRVKGLTSCSGGDINGNPLWQCSTFGGCTATTSGCGLFGLAGCTGTCFCRQQDASGIPYWVPCAKGVNEPTYPGPTLPVYPEEEAKSPSGKASDPKVSAEW